MRVFIGILVLIFSFQSWAKANDISDFEIEGMSVGDSLLDYYSESEIKDGIVEEYYTYVKKNPGKFLGVEFFNSEGKLYDGYQFSIKKNDNRYKIYMVKGLLITTSLSQCKKNQKKIDKELSNLFEDLYKEESEDPHEADPSGKSMVYSITYWFKNNDLIDIDCYDWALENRIDHLRIGATTAEFNNWIGQID